MNWYILIIIIALIVFLLIESCIECKKISVNSITIINNKIPNGFDGTSFVFISDLHNAKFGKDNNELVSKIKELSPEFIILGGDMIVGKEGVSTDIAKDFINCISKEFNVYYGVGNHEMKFNNNEKYNKIWNDYYNSMININYMKDKVINIKRGNDSINLIGLDLDSEFYKRFRLKNMEKGYLENKLGKVANDNFNILIGHNPEYFKNYIDYGADLVLSGHIHGGIIRLPFLGGIISPRLKLFPKYDKGIYNINEKIMYLSSGLGTHTIKLRLNNIPEIVSITLKK